MLEINNYFNKQSEQYNMCLLKHETKEYLLILQSDFIKKNLFLHDLLIIISDSILMELDLVKHILLFHS